ncbi:DUF4352 domain-containing protein [Streptomyces sp. NPDC020141]|uniref:DUF4352 domain-containing protein n=1 Tax=Streptomyces sp. NPDC020141 TaxID=3365065 RepID=UPI0037BA1BA9
MTPSARRLAVTVAAAMLSAAVISGCSSDTKTDHDAAKQSTVPAAPVAEASEEPSEPSSAPVLAVGQTGEYTAVDSADEAVKTAMKVTVESVKYVTPADVRTTTKAKGVYAVLTLTVKNAGSQPGTFLSYGVMKWQDRTSAAQTATTLKTTGKGDQLDTTYRPGQSATGDIVLDVARRGGTVSHYDSLEGPSFTVKMPK